MSASSSDPRCSTRHDGDPGPGDGNTCGVGAAFRSVRVATYDRMFGPPLEVDSGSDGVDVRIYEPGFAERSFYTLVTCGMSDAPMPGPPELGRDVLRAELILYVDQPGTSLVRLMRTLALMPRRMGIWLGHGHTLPNGDPPAPLFSGSVLDTLLILDTNVMPEREVWRHVALDGDPLRLLHPLPITSRECALKVSAGLAALLDRFDERKLSFVLDPGRDDVTS